MNDLDILFSDEFRASVEANLDRDPVRIALDKRLPHAALVASQVKYLRRAERKLPSYHAARCVLPPLAFEQSSSEQTAARKDYSGRLAIDLTCGLGVDSLYLSRWFERVVAIERDPELAIIARENFRRLGAYNIEVVNTSAEELLMQIVPTTSPLLCKGTPPLQGGEFLHTPLLDKEGWRSKTDGVVDFTNIDLIYADPDRRGADGKKLVRIEDCSPDIAALLPQIRRVTPRLVVKLSPLFDVDEVFRVFGRNTRVEVVSLDGECKEIIAEVGFSTQTSPSAAFASATPPKEGNPTSTVHAIAIGLGEAGFPLLPEGGVAVGTTDGMVGLTTQPFEPEKYRHLVIPDVALQKARLAWRYFTERGIYIDSDNGYGFAAEEPENIMGRALEIESIEPFDPKSLKRRLKTGGIKSIDILRRNFPLSAVDIARQLGIREGGATKIAFTKAAGRLWQIYLTKR